MLRGFEIAPVSAATISSQPSSFACKQKENEMSTWLPKAQAIKENDLRTLEEFGFEWIDADESAKKRKDDCILLGLYVHPASNKAFAAIVVNDADSIIGKKYLYYSEALVA